jgi:hypothetical protein
MNILYDRNDPTPMRVDQFCSMIKVARDRRDSAAAIICSSRLAIFAGGNLSKT